MIYSPLPRTSYMREVSETNTKTGIASSGFLDAPGVWNLFYLSEPKVDEYLEWAKGRTDSPEPDASVMVWLCSLTCKVVPELAEALETLPAAEIPSFIRKIPGYESLSIYKELQENWFNIMSERAKPKRGILGQVGNVLKVDFGGHILTSPPMKSSVILMPMSYDKH